MKKTLLTSLLSVLMISPVLAENVSSMDSESARNKAKEICQKHSDTHFWVKSDGVCVPLNPCDRDAYKNRYCESSAFGKLSLTEDEAREVINIFTEKFKLDCKPVLGDVNRRLTGDDAYVKCIGNDYKAFKFDTIFKNHEKLYGSKQFIEGKCFAVSAKLVVPKGESMYYPEQGCVLISDADCAKLGGTMVPFDYTAMDVYTPNYVDSPADISALSYSSELVNAKEYCKMQR